MFIPLITSSAVAVVSGAWTAASIFVKYFLAGLAAKNLYQGTLTKETFLEDVEDSSEAAVAVLIAAGVVFSVSGLSPSPLLKLFSQLVALGYFAYLFWMY